MSDGGREHIAMIAGEGFLKIASAPASPALFRIDVWKPVGRVLVADGDSSAEKLPTGQNDRRATLTLGSGEIVRIELSADEGGEAAFTVLDPVVPTLL